jgi:hypothetical protein
MTQERTYRVRLTLKRLAAIRGLPIDNECMPIRRREDGMIEMEALVPESTMAKLRRMRKREVFVELLGDRTAETAEAMKLVSRTNRYANGVLPVGPGTRKG